MGDFFDLTNMTAAVIGGTSGIGLAISKALALAGANVVTSGRRSREVEAAVATVEALGSKSLAQTCDVTNQDRLERLLHAVCSKFGGVHILVNCAGRTKRTPTLELPDAEWDAIIETNLTGTLRACRVFGRHVRSLSAIERKRDNAGSRAGEEFVIGRSSV